MLEFFILFIPFTGTALGSAFVFFLSNQMNVKVEKMMLGFAAGVMIAASVWSLLIPSIDMSESMGGFACVPAAVGFMVGIIFLLILDFFIPYLQCGAHKLRCARKGIPHLHMKRDCTEEMDCKISSTTMLVFAVTLHNLPEGMAVGVTFAGALMGNTGMTFAGAFTLALGIAIQNIPEGAIISMPLYGEGMTKRKSFVCGVLSGAVEPVGAVVTVLLAAQIPSILPYLLSFAAGAMIYVVVEELIPETQTGEYSDLGTIGAAVGFVLMMVLDVVLG